MTESHDKNNKIPLIGKLALRHELIRPSDLDKALDTLKESENFTKAFCQYLEEKKLISSLDMKRLTIAAKAMAFRQKDRAFGNIALRKGYLTRSLLEMALEEQKNELTKKKRSRLLGEILVEAGMLTTKQVDKILTKQKRLKEIERLRRQETEDIPSKPSEKALSTTSDVTTPDDTTPDPTTTAVQEDTEIFEGGIKLTIPLDFQSAYLLKTDEFDPDIPVEDIKAILDQKYIIFGIVDDSLIQGFIRSSGFRDKPFRIASGIKPLPGKDATIEYFFETDRLQVGKLNSTGSMDFKERGEIPRVEEGFILSRKTPLVEEQNGKNIFGEIIAVPRAQNVKFKYGKGARLSEDGLEIRAAVNGQPNLAWSGIISVLEEFTTKGDVDYETGHIDYQGNIKIQGCIRSGFKVTGNSIRAQEIDGGIINADGDVSIAGSIIGAKIYAKGNVWAKFIHKSEILCMGDIYVTKEIIESTVESSGAFVINKGKIISSAVTAKMGVFADGIGTDVSAPSTIQVGADIFVLKELTRLKEDIDKIKQDITDLKTKKKEQEKLAEENQEKTTRLAHIQDRSTLEQKDTISKIANMDKDQEMEEIKEMKARLHKLKQDAAQAEKDITICFNDLDTLDDTIQVISTQIPPLKETLENLLTERNALGEWSKNNPGKSIIEANGIIMPGTKVIGKHSETTIDQHISKTKIKELLFSNPERGTKKEWWEMRIMSI